MTTTDTRPGSTSEVVGAGLTGTARTTGVLYLGLAVTGVLGSVLVRGQLYVADDPGATLSNLVDHTSMARLGIVLELGIVLTQALVAVWFYRLFRSVDTFAAGLVAVFGIVNAAAILGRPRCSPRPSTSPMTSRWPCPAVRQPPSSCCT